MKKEMFQHPGSPVTGGRSTRMEGDLLSLGGECSNKFSEGKMETYTDRSVLITCPALIASDAYLLVQAGAGC